MRKIYLGLVLCGVSAAAGADNAMAVIAYSSSGSTYTQNFDSLASTDTGNPNPWANDSTIEGWNLFRVTAGSPTYDPTPVAVASYDAGTGAGSSSVAEGRFFSFGTAGVGERALGATGHGNFADATNVSFGNVVGWVAANIINNTGGTLPEFTVGFNGEQWRDAGNGVGEVDTMVFEYGFGASFGTVASWSAPGGAFDWTSPVATASGGAVNGNSASPGGGLVTGRGGTIDNLTWADGDTLWLRWVELNDGGPDHGLAIDSFTFSAGVAAVPEPGAYLFGALVCSAIGIAATARKLFASHRP